MPHRRHRNTVTFPSWTIVVAIVGFAAWGAFHPDPIYGPVADFTVTRCLDTSGRDRVYIDARILKLENCDLESGNGPP